MKQTLFEKLNEIKFQGKPVNMDPLINSITPNRIEKIKNELIIFFEQRIENKYVIKPQNIAKKVGNKIMANGIKN